MTGSSEQTHDTATRELRLTEVQLGRWCEVRRIGRKAELLAGFCIYPGARLQMRQKFPGCVIAAEGLEFALEDRLADEVWVREIEG